MKCKFCSNDIISEDSKLFCNRSCSASYNNSHRTIVNRTFNEVKLTNIKLSNVKRKNSNIEKYNLSPSYCTICNMVLPYNKRNASTCSKHCFRQLMSNDAINKQLGGSTIQKRVVTLTNGISIILDSSWEELLANEFVLHDIFFEKGKKFILPSGKSYTPDFYLPDHNLYIDPKAISSFFKTQSSQLQKIKEFEICFNTKVIIISNKKNLKWSYIKEMLER